MQLSAVAMLTKSDYLPTIEELKVEECPLGSPYLKAGAFHLGKQCEATNNEFMLCRQEYNDPRSEFITIKFIVVNFDSTFLNLRHLFASERHTINLI